MRLTTKHPAKPVRSPILQNLVQMEKSMGELQAEVETLRDEVETLKKEVKRLRAFVGMEESKT